MKEYIHKNIRLASYAFVIAALFAALMSLCYYNGDELVTIFYGSITAVGHFFVLLWFILGVPTLFFSIVIRSIKVFKLYLSIVLSIIAVVLVTDIIVYSQYRFHINLAMIDLFLNAGNTISFSIGMWLKIACIAVGIVGFCLAIVWGASKISERRGYSHKFTGALVGTLVIAELVYMVAFARYNMELIAIKNYIPLFQPLTANRYMVKLGIKSKESPVATDNLQNDLHYPLNIPTFEKNSGDKPKNIIFVMADSLRADMINEEVMPKTWAWAQNEILLNYHYSSSHSTRGGIFGLFYSLPPTYWSSFLTSRIQPVFITTLQEKGYDIQAFATETLASPEFADTVFAKVRPLRIESKGNSPINRDINSVEDFEAYLEKRDKSGDKRPFFAFVFLDTTHGYTHPKEFKRFKPSWDNPDYLKLKNGMDPLPFKNLYKNSAAWTDDLFGKTLSAIEKHKLIDNSIIMVSSDHGQEMNDSQKNFWGHNSAYTDAQTRIPGIIHWPGKNSYVENRMTVCYDIPMTILRHEFGMTSKMEDIGVGYDLFGGELEKRKWFILAGYSNAAIREKDRIIEIDRMGLLEFYDTMYNKHANKQRSNNIWEAFELMSKYRKH